MLLELYEGMKDTKVDIKDICIHMSWMKYQLEGWIDTIHQTSSSKIENVEQDANNLTTFSSGLEIQLKEIEGNTQAWDSQIEEIQVIIGNLEDVQQQVNHITTQVTNMDVFSEIYGGGFC